MISANTCPKTSLPLVVLAALHVTFLDRIMPAVEKHARFYFRSIRCHVRKEEAISEAVAISWKWTLRLAERGKDATRFPSALATFAARSVKSGRRLAGMERPKDVLSRRAQREHGFSVESLPSATAVPYEQLHSGHGQQHLDAYEERLRDNTVTPPPEQAAFRIDFPAWLETLTARERRLIKAMTQNERTKDLSRQFEVSPARISQMRREFHTDWQRFVDEPVEA